MVRSWIRQALRASGVAILVPAAVVAAIALSVVGGHGGPGSLGEVLTGPAVPPAEAAQVEAAPRRHARPRMPTAAARLVGAPISAPRARAPVGRRQVTTLPVGPPRPARPPKPAAAQPAPAATAPQTAPPPASRPHPINDAGTQVAETVRPLPVAGPVAAGAVQAVVDLVDPPA